MASASLKAWMAAFVRISSHMMGIPTELQPENASFLEFLREHPALLRPPKRPRESPQETQATKRPCFKSTPTRDPRLRRRSKSADGGPAQPTAPAHAQPPTAAAPWRPLSPSDPMARCGLKGVVLRNLDIAPTATTSQAPQDRPGNTSEYRNTGPSAKGPNQKERDSTRSPRSHPCCPPARGTEASTPGPRQETDTEAGPHTTGAPTRTRTRRTGHGRTEAEGPARSSRARTASANPRTDSPTGYTDTNDLICCHGI
ncbi:putative HTLV-1-related endogenous sequence [Cydia pomonella]|uniref:putative HTLV-1-related endogenous sequence n=1 Tax=Cydia pomonella TaxID=82600 RepID=UPI002ADE72DE|nr:putative HTLV-1-related endogenous sequence [Cydia pomonella]